MASSVPVSRPVSGRTDDDSVLPFAVTPLDVRGRIVRLGPTVDRILSQHNYPPEIARLTGEAIALTVILGSSLKDDGRFQLQTRTDGVVSMLVVDFEAPGNLRAYARYEADALAAARAEGGTSPQALLGKGHLALTIDRGSASSRYQGVVALEGQGLEAAAHQYFQQSEQIPTRVRLAVAEPDSAGAAQPQWRAGGLMVQFLPDSPERLRAVQRELATPPGWTGGPAAQEDDAWNEAMALAGSVEDGELTDPALSSERLLYRLFNERGVTVFEPSGVRHACRCERHRVVAMLRQFGQDDLRDMVSERGRIEVTCEFCGLSRDFDPADFGIT
ncbi:MAG: Hsp33 family molecular chaperone [Beijerinckiaceae bacterium]